jgi:hypothetical protein
MSQQGTRTITATYSLKRKLAGRTSQIRLSLGWGNGSCIPHSKGHNWQPTDLSGYLWEAQYTKSMSDDQQNCGCQTNTATKRSTTANGNAPTPEPEIGQDKYL